MMCFRDRTWCNEICGNFNCSRNFTEEDRKHAIEWWGGKDFPVALSNFKTEHCGYVPVQEHANKEVLNDNE